MTLRPYQSRTLEKIKTALNAGVNRQLLKYPTGCHAKGQLLLMYNGLFKRVEDVEVGDQLMGLDSQPRTVLSLARGTGLMYRVIPVKGDPFVVNEDHILTLIRTNDGSPLSGQLTDISIKEYLDTHKTWKHIHKLYRAPVEYFDGGVDELPLDPYFLGVLLGDGSLVKGAIGVCKPDDEIMEECAVQARQWGCALRVATPDNRARSYHFKRIRGTSQTNPIAAQLEQLGLRGLHSEDKFIPAMYKTSSIENRFSLLAGLMDTDGHFIKGCYDYVSSSKTLAQDVCFTARSVGLAAYLKPSVKYCQTGAGGIYWRVYISGRISHIPCRIERKQAPQRQQIKDVRRTGFRLEPLNVDDFYGFTLDGDGRYLMDDFTVTHNTGKTCIFSALPDALDMKGRMLVITHREELTDQAVDKLRKWNPGRTVGVEMAERRSSPSDQIVVAGVQTVGRKNSPRLLQFHPADFDAVVCDESHHFLASSYQTIGKHFRVFEDHHRLLLGVTATVNRADGRGLGEVFQTIVDDISILDAIRDGWLVDLKCLRIKSATNLDGVHSKGGDFDPTELVGTVDNPARNDLVVRGWLEHGQDRQTIVFAVDVQHSKNLAEAFKRYGVSAEAIWGGDPDRSLKLEMFRKGLLRVLVNCQILVEGFDAWQVGCVVFARPTQSETFFVQALGRGTRIQDGIGNLVEAKQLGKQILKEDCIVLDVVDVTSKHSLVRLPTLFGMNQEMDLRGKSLSTVMREIDEVKEKYPYVDIAKVTDINSLKTYAEKVDLFKVNFAPEVIQLSEYQWHKTGEDSYVLMLTGGESVCLVSDMLDNWHVRGWVNGVRVEDVRNTFDECIREADARVKVLGGKSLETLIKREEKWHRDEPSLLQLNLCRRLRISVPPGATKGEVHQRLTAKFARRKQERNRERMFAA